MIILDHNIDTPNGIIFRGAVKILRKAGNRYVIKRGKLVGYAYKNELRFINEKQLTKVDMRLLGA